MYNHGSNNCKAHCLDTVRQALMCHIDTGVLGQVWIDPEEPTAFPDFRTKHTCKNYEDIREWAKHLQVRTSSNGRYSLIDLLLGATS